jgi:diguanylate cyclase
VGSSVSLEAVPQWRRRDKVLIAALIGMLQLVSGIALWSTLETAHSARQAVWASRLSDLYASAAHSVAAEQSADHTYRLEPSAEALAIHTRSGQMLDAALEQALAQEDPRDRPAVAAARAAHRRYQDAVGRMFVAVDHGDAGQARRIDEQQVDPAFAELERLVGLEAGSHTRFERDTDARQERQATFTLWAMPVMIVTGTALGAGLGLVLRRLRRQAAEHHRQALHGSLHDGLTGLPNRALLAERLLQTLADDGRPRAATGLLLIDLDRFKEINDTLGHHYGDAVLAQVGSRIAGQLDDRDTVARLGGDEFAVLLPEIGDVDTALEVARRVQAALAGPFPVDVLHLDVEASIGVVVSGEHGDDAGTLLQHADIAMYVAKQQGTGVCVYDAGTDGHSPERLSLLGDLRRGMDRGELALHYQPKVDLETGRLVGVEALLRWQHPVRGMVPPDDFIPLAEHTGLIGPLTGYVLDAALTQIRDWEAVGLTVPVAVNLSARNLFDRELVTDIRALLERHRVPARLLEVEVTESAIMLDPGAGPGHAERAARARHPDRDRRLRRRLHQPGPAQHPAGGRPEDRPVVRRHDGHRHRERDDRTQHHRPGPQPRDDDDRRRGRGRGHPGHADRAGLRRRPGLPPVPAAAAGRVPGLDGGRAAHPRPRGHHPGLTGAGGHGA